MILLQLYKSRQTQYIHWNPNLSQSQLSCPPYARTDHGHTCVLKEKLNHEIITDLPTMGRQWLPLRRPAQTGSTIATWVFGRWLCRCAKRDRRACASRRPVGAPRPVEERRQGAPTWALESRKGGFGGGKLIEAKYFFETVRDGVSTLPYKMLRHLCCESR